MTGGMAAARGGVTTVCAMPNTKPVIDTKEKVEEVHRRAKEESGTRDTAGLHDYGECGEELSIYRRDGTGRLLCTQRRWKICHECLLFGKPCEKKENDLLIFSHCEDISMVKKAA